MNSRLRLHPSKMAFEQIDAPLVADFLEDLETQRGLSVRSRNLRLAAIHSFFRYAAFEMPAHAAQIQRVLAIPSKRFTRKQVSFLNREEVDALLAAPDKGTWSGRRDHAFILTAVQTGLRVSEMTALKRQEFIVGSGAHLRVVGKGRKERCTPLAKPTQAVLGLRICAVKNSTNRMAACAPSWRIRGGTAGIVGSGMIRSIEGDESGMTRPAGDERRRESPLRRHEIGQIVQFAGGGVEPDGRCGREGRSEEERRALRASFSSVLPEKISFAPAPDIVARGGQSGKLAAVAHKTHPLHKRHILYTKPLTAALTALTSPLGPRVIVSGVCETRHIVQGTIIGS